MQYLLPCECGARSPVEVGQAGQQILCNCGRRIEVPTMRVIRTLEPADGNASSFGTGARLAWGPTRGFIFSLGLLIAAIGGIGGAGLAWLQSRIEPVDHSREFARQIDEMGPYEAFYEWSQHLNRGLMQSPPQEVLEQQRKRSMQRWSKIGLIAAALGGVASAIALLVPARAGAPRAPLPRPAGQASPSR